jgi:hypothetical protein
MATDWRHESKLVEQYNLQAQQKTRASKTMHRWTIHHCYFNDTALLFLGFELNVCREEGMGYGLKTNVFIPRGRPITQYEGIVCTRDEADEIRERKDGKFLASWFASTHLKGYVINGITLQKSPTPDPTPGKSPGTPLAWNELKGYGGGSFCNHADNPNAKLVRCHRGDGLGVFVVAVKDIEPKSFIHVSYGASFVRSKWSNL